MPAGQNPIPTFQGIGETISSKWLQVPPYQRSYAWEEEHVQALYEDISDAIATGENQYFLGSIITTHVENNVLEVIDGQQRLATATILLAAIRDYIFTNEDKDRAEAIRNKYLTTKDEYTMTVKPKLKLNRDDADFFTDYVLADPGHASRRVKAKKSSHKRIAKAFELAGKHVIKFTGPYRDTDKSKHLMKLVRFISESACAICFTVSDHANAYTLFETLNDRGLELSQADLVKNFLFASVGRDNLEPAQQNWAEMLGSLENAGGRDITATYIRHQWISKKGRSKDRAFFKNIKKGITSPDLALAAR